MAEQKRILVVGSSNMDLSMNMFKVPEKGETLIDDGGVAYTPGGKGANAAVAFHKLGGACAFLTKLGADLHGQKLYGYFKELGLDTSHIKVDRELPTGFAAVLKEADGANRIVYYPGANLSITRDDILDAFSSRPDAIYLNFEISFETALTAARIAEAREVPIFVDGAPADRDFPLESLPPLEVFSPNETETLAYTGIMPAGADSALRAALALWRRVKCKYLVIKQGARGAFVYDGKHYTIIPAFRPDKLVDTTAAGDAFTAAFTLKYLELSGDAVTAAKYAAAVGAIVVSRSGAASSMPTASEVVDFVRRRLDQQF